MWVNWGARQLRSGRRRKASTSSDNSLMIGCLRMEEEWLKSECDWEYFILSAKLADINSTNLSLIVGSFCFILPDVSIRIPIKIGNRAFLLKNTIGSRAPAKSPTKSTCLRLENWAAGLIYDRHVQLERPVACPRTYPHI